jgi:hypothetical protein
MKYRPPLRLRPPHGKLVRNGDRHSDHDGHDTPQPLYIRPYAALEVRSYADTPELEATWEPSHYAGISLWGHTVVGENVATVMNKFQAAVRSLREREETVPALSTTPKGARR